MSRRIQLLCVALIVPIIVSSSHVALAQRYGGYRGYGSRIGFFDSGIGAFGGGTYPGRAFGYDPRYLASRSFTAGGVAGCLTYRPPQPAGTPAAECTALLAPAAMSTTCS